MFSVILPAYNADPGYLDAAVNSVLAQSYGDLELIIVDDGSTDDTGTIADRFATADSRVRVLHTPNGGLSRARNAALDIARGQHITFIDADDILHPDALAVMKHIADDTDADIVCVGAVKKQKLLGRPPKKPVITLSPADMLTRVLRQRHYAFNNAAWAKLYRRDLFDDLRFTPGTAYEDLDLVPRLIARANTVAVTRQPLYFYRQHPAAFTHRLTPGRYDAIHVTQQLEQWLADPDNPVARPDLTAAARDRHFSAAYNLLNLLNTASIPADAPDLRGNNNTPRLSPHQYRDLCLTIIRERRAEVLRSPKARLKNRIGAALAYLGPSFLRLTAKTKNFFRF